MLYQGVNYIASDFEFKEAAMQSGGKSNGEGVSLALPKHIPAGVFLSDLQDGEEVRILLRLIGSNEETIFSIRGFIGTVAEEEHLLMLSVGTIRSALAHMGLSTRYSDTCHYVLYSGSCKVVATPKALTIAGEYASASGGGHLLQYDGVVADASKYSDGYLTVEVGASTIHTPILEILATATHTYIVIPKGFSKPVTGKVVSLYRGCDLTFKTCHDRFNNTENYGGFPFFTGKENPFTDTALDN
jgi:hypothetical protein